MSSRLTYKRGTGGSPVRAERSSENLASSNVGTAALACPAERSSATPHPRSDFLPAFKAIVCSSHLTCDIRHRVFPAKTAKILLLPSERCPPEV